MVSNWFPTGFRLIFDWFQTGFRLVSEWFQIGFRSMYLFIDKFIAIYLSIFLNLLPLFYNNWKLNIWGYLVL